MVEVVKGGAGDLEAGFTSMSPTEKEAFSHAFTNCAASSLVSNRLESSALNDFPSTLKTAVTRKYEEALKFWISRSLSTMRRTVTLCTRPALREGFTFLHNTGDSSNPTKRSSTRRACWALTKLMSNSRGLAMALSMADLVIS